MTTVLFRNIWYSSCYSINILAFLQSWLNHKRNLMNHKNSKNKANTKKYIKKWERKSGVICNFTTNKIVAFELWRQRVLPDVSMVHSRKSNFSMKLPEKIFTFGKNKKNLVLSENKFHFVNLLSLANSDYCLSQTQIWWFSQFLEKFRVRKNCNQVNICF